VQEFGRPGFLARPSMLGQIGREPKA